LEENEITGAQLLQEQRSQSFASLTANRIQGSENCLFSLLPWEELARMARSWYEACSQAMLRGNFAAIDQWVRNQSLKAVARGFSLEDVVELLQICRSSAVETEQWNPDIFSPVEEVIAEALRATNHRPTRREEDGATPEQSDSGASLKTVEPSGERRNFGRNHLQFPIRVRSAAGPWRAEEITVTNNISRGGLYFVTEGYYQEEQVLQVCYPYWTDSGAINQEYPAKVGRIERLSDKTWGVAIQFLESLVSKSE
jgi:PilZ domain